MSAASLPSRERIDKRYGTTRGCDGVGRVVNCLLEGEVRLEWWQVSGRAATRETASAGVCYRILKDYLIE